MAQVANPAVHRPAHKLLPDFPRTGNTVQDLVAAVDMLVVAVNEESKGRADAEKALAETRRLHQQDQETAYACFEEERVRREKEEEQASVALVQERKLREEEVAKAAELLAQERQARLLAEAKLADMQAKIRAFAGLKAVYGLGLNANNTSTTFVNGNSSTTFVNGSTGSTTHTATFANGNNVGSLSPDSSYAPTPATDFGRLGQTLVPEKREKRVSFGSGSRLNFGNK
ncbi:uncharacterized protein LOC62_07G008928 [Vanrija pseudolonga]|uniref:Uncharacterized protein n=1 Tax=Vanrija pseudolonga TaxID=143232 RepID=A0AAF0YHT1_9TREE|nr:hypothetical protein LOC62_07G008928 [Vanrija pseudolonga]